MTVTISGAGRRFQLVGVGLVLVALLLAVFARPASAAVTGTATPSTGLGLTGTLAISAGGFDPGNPPSRPVVFVIECSHGATDSSSCDANTVSSSRGTASGTYTDDAYTYYSLPNDTFGGVDSITCDATHACDLVVIQDDYNNFSNPHVNIPITFSAVAATTTSPPTTIPASTVPTTATTAPTSATTSVSATTTATSDPTTTTGVGGTSTTVKGGASSTLGGQGSGSTLPPGSDGFGAGGSGGSSGSGGTLPFTGPPTAAPIIAICGIVIILAGTLMRRVVLNVPDAGVRVS